MEWVKRVQQLRQRREPAVLVTVAAVRGHSPREAGAKMVVGLEHTWDTVGGGNLEAVAVDRARELIAAGTDKPEMITMALSDKASAQYGVQCCGGEVTLMLEPLPVVPAVAIFGMGHVGLELARVLARHDLELHLIDSRPDQLSAERLSVLDDAVAGIHVHPVPVLPELVLAELPPGAHAVVMTHDHAEDFALCDAALRHGRSGSGDDGTRGLATIGLIGSSAKWTRFRRKLGAEGHTADELARITSPIGLPNLPGKEPAVIAVSVAAWLLQRIEQERKVTPADSATPAQGNARKPVESPSSARRIT